MKAGPSGAWGLICVRDYCVDLPSCKMDLVTWAQAGEAFSDLRQNERRIEFIRTGDAFRIVGQLKGEPTPFVGLEPIFIASGQRKFLWR